MSGERLILASKSAARRSMLQNAGVAFEARAADVDEAAIKAVSTDLDPIALAVRLAQAKALAVSSDDPDAWVLGSDQTLAFDGGLVSKAVSMAAARDRLKAMRGKTHTLHSGAALATKGEPLKLVKSRPVVFRDANNPVETKIYETSFPENGAAVEGPCIIEFPGQSVVVPPGYGARADGFGNLHVKKDQR